jgi:hypothetical protein
MSNTTTTPTPVLQVGQPFILQNASGLTFTLLAFTQDGHRLSMEAKQVINHTMNAEPGAIGATLK